MLYFESLVAMNFHAGTHLVVPLIGLLVMLSSAPLLVTAVQCPAESVVNENGSLIYRPLSPGSDIADPVYDPGVIGGWYSLAAGFVDVVRSGSLPYGEYNITCIMPSFKLPTYWAQGIIIYLVRIIIYYLVTSCPRPYFFCYREITHTHVHCVAKCLVTS